MKGKKLVIIFSSVLGLCVLFAVVVRFSYRQITPEQIRSYSLSSVSLTSLMEDQEITGFQDCADEADVILIGTCLGISAYTDEALYSKIQVETVLKGEEVPEEITLIDQIYLNPDNQSLLTWYGRLPLREGERCLFLLSKASFDPARSLPEEMQSPFFPVYGSAFGCFLLSGERQDFVIPRQPEMTLLTLPPNSQVLTESEEELDFYNQIREEALLFAKRAAA